MDEELIDDSSIPLSRRTRLPGAGFFYPDSLDDERAEQRAKETLTDIDAVVIADADADGLACAAMVREQYGASLDVADFEAEIADRLADDTETTEDTDATDETAPSEDDTEEPHERSTVALLAAGPYSIDDSLDRVLEYAAPGIDVFICDLCPDDFEWIADPLTELVDHAGPIRWFDHHQWDDETAKAVRNTGVDLIIGDSEEECTADVALRSLPHEFDERWTELAAVTRDHDLWLKEDPRSDDLADYAYWTGAEEYVTVIGAYGADLPETVERFLDHRRVEKRNRIDAAVDRAVVHEIGDWSVAVTYGRCSQNEVAESLRENGADAAVIVKPAGSASIRGSDDFERAHEVAGQVNGGGHPKAAGCKPDIYDDMLDYAHHWTTEGQAARKVILSAFEAVAADVAETTADADETIEGENE